MKNKPARLAKQQDEMEEIKELLNGDLVIRIKFYIILTILMIIFLFFCFLVQHQTYGFINW